MIANRIAVGVVGVIISLFLLLALTPLVMAEGEPQDESVVPETTEVVVEEEVVSEETSTSTDQDFSFVSDEIENLVVVESEEVPTEILSEEGITEGIVESDSPPVLSTDKEDYHPGETATIFGKFFQPFQQIVLHIFGYGATGANYTEEKQTITTDEEGSFTTTYLLDGVFRPIYTVVATTIESNFLSETTFLDSRLINSATVNGGTSVSVAPGATISAGVNVTTDQGGANDDWLSTSWRIGSSGLFTCSNTNDHTSAGSFTEVFNITAPVTPGVYNVSFIAYQGAGCTTNPSATFTLTNGVTVTGGGATAQTITVTTPAPVTAVNGGTFNVAASASSGLGVAITTSGSCSGSGTNTALITMTSDIGVCTVNYNQAGNGTYSPAPQQSSNTTAQGLNALASVDQYSQCANDDGDGYSGNPGDCDWTNGNLNSSNSTYTEGDATVQRLAIDGLTPGNHTVTIQYDSLKGGKHAYDFLTSDIFSEDWVNSADLCASPITNFASCASAPVSYSSTIPTAPNTNNGSYNTDENAGPERKFAIRNGTWVSIGTPTIVGGGDVPTNIQLTFNVPSNCLNKYQKQGIDVCEVLISFGAHISTQEDWGTGNSAVDISGSPYHVRVVELDGGTVGNRDNQMAASAIVPLPGQIIIEKQTIPDGNTTDFTFNPSWSNSDFTLSDGETNNSGDLVAGTYSVSETVPSGWTQTSAICSDGSPVGSISLQPGEIVTCVFTNTLQTGTIIVDKVTNPSGASQAFSFTTTGSGYGGFALADASTPNSQVLNAGNYSVAETAVTGWELTNTSCASSIGDTENAGSLELDAGETITCTFNNGKLPTLELQKTVVTDNGGTATESSFTPSIDGEAAITWDQVVTLDPGTYDVDETNLPGYTASPWGGDCTDAGGVTLDYGDEAVCTITNDDQQAYITVVKVVTNDDGGNADPDDFDLTLEGNPVTSGVQVAVNPGTYTAGETLLDGYTFEGFSGDCDENGDITVALGESKTCTLTNDDEQAYITVVKVVTNNNGGSALPDDFDLTLEGNAVSSGAAVPVDPGTYTAGETLLSGYTFTGFSGDCNGNGDVTVALGESKTCTLTNDDQQSYIVVNKTVVNDNGGTAGPNDFLLTVNDNAVLDEVAYPVNPGTHQAGETLLTGYTAGDWGGDCSVSGSVSVALGQTKTCTITNNDNVPKLTLNKIIINDNGGTSDESDWNLTATGPTSITGPGAAGDADVVSDATFDAGEYVLSESEGPDGYTATGWTCSNGDNDGTISLALGDDVTCSITNNDDAPSLTLIKEVINDNGGVAIESDFTLIATGPTGFSGAGPSVSNGASFDAGSYDLSEATDVDGYTASDWVCVGGSQDDGDTISLELGESATCTITNTDDAPSLTLVKEVTNDDGGDAVKTEWNLSATGPTSISGAGGATSDATFDAGTYDLAESAGPSGYTAGEWSCEGGTQNGSEITLALGQDATCTIINDDQPGKLRVTKITDPVSDNTTEFDITADVTDGQEGFVEGDESVTIVGGQTVEYTVHQGTYDVTEAAETGWVETANDCDAVEVPNGGVGECTITNVKLGTVTIVKNGIPNDPQDFSFTNDFGDPHPATFSLDDDATVTLPKSRDFAVMPGIYEVTEDPTAGWKFDGATCDDGSGVDAINVSAGEHVTCTFVNKKLGTITLIKETIGGDGTFDFVMDGVTLPETAQAVTVNGENSQDFTGIDPDNTYGITETVPEGWDLTAASCVNENDVIDSTPESFEINNGGHVTCTFENTKRGTIIIDKVTVGGDATFSFDASGGEDPVYTDFNLAGADPVNSQELIPGVYGVAEAAKEGWDLTALSCDDSNSEENLEDGEATINLEAGETVTCTFTNTERGSITVVKQTLPDGDTTEFTFGGDLVGGIIDGGSLSDEVAPGTYSVTETVPEGWTLGSISCSDQDSLGDTATGVTSYEVAAGEDVSCTYTNVKNPFIEIGDTETNEVGDDHTFTVKVGQNGTGGFTPVADGTIVDVTFTPDVTPDADTCATGTVAGLCTVTINSADAGVFTAHASADVTIGDVLFELETDDVAENSADAVKTYVDADITIGEDGVNSITDPHTFTATVMEDDGVGEDPAAGETVTFTLVNNNAGAFFVDNINTCVTDANGQCSISINSNTVGTVEVNAAVDVSVGGLTLSRNTDGVSGNSDNGLKTYVAGKIVVEKVTVGGDGDFSFTADYDNDGFILSDGESDTSADLAFGEYSVSETVPAGWDLTSATCDNGDNPASITIDAEETVTCTFTNTARGKIIVEKEVEGDTDVEFEFDTNYSENFDLTGGDFNDSGFIVAGDYSVSETVPAGWDQTSATCDDQSDPADIDLAPGETVTCTFTNVERGHLIVEKTTLPAGDLTSFTINASGNGTITGGGAGLITDANDKDYEVTPGTYSVAETVPAGWDKTGDTCQNVVVAAGETKTCTITNTKRATVTIIKDAQPNDGQNFAFSGSFGAFTLDDDAGVVDVELPNAYQNTITFNNVVPGDKTITETQPNQYWKLKSASCVVTGTNTVVASSLVGQTLSVNAAPGADITCTFVNEKIDPTRTQGFWQTHTAYTSAKFAQFFGAGMTIGTPTKKTIVTAAQLFGGWYSNIAKTTANKQRTALDKARMQLLQQLITAKLNCATFGCSANVQTMIANAETAYSGTSAAAIITAAGLVDTYNNSGDSISIGNAGKATPKDSQSLADKAFWNTTQ